jgi:hypothetical protein
MLLVWMPFTSISYIISLYYAVLIEFEKYKKKEIFKSIKKSFMISEQINFYSV